jgi:hypothetical protein
MSPTYEALKKLAGGLAISVPQLFTPPSKQQVMGRMAVTKAGEGQAQATVTYEHELAGGAADARSRCCPIARRSGRASWTSSTAGSAMTARNSCMS